MPESRIGVAAQNLAGDVGGITSKIAKDTTAMFKAIKDSASVMDLIVMGFEAFSPLALVMEAFRPIIEIVGGLFQVMSAQILPVLMQALRPLMDILISLTPIFILIGKVIGILLEVALIPLQLIFALIAAVIEPLLPLLQPLIDALDALSPVIEVLTDVLINGLLWVVKVVAFGIGTIVNTIINIINAIMNALTVGAWDDIGTIRLPSFDSGGRMLQDGLAKMKAGEMAITGNQMGAVEDGISTLIEQNKQAQRVALW